MRTILALVLLCLPIDLEAQRMVGHAEWTLLGSEVGQTSWVCGLQSEPYSFIFNDEQYGKFYNTGEIYPRVLWPLPPKPNAGDTFKVRVSAGRGQLIWVVTTRDNKHYNTIAEFTGDGLAHELQFPVWFYPGSRQTLIGLGVPKWIDYKARILNPIETVFVDCSWYKRRQVVFDTVTDTTRRDSTLGIEPKYDPEHPVIVADILGRVVFTGHFKDLPNLKGVYVWRRKDGRKGSGLLLK